MAEQNQDPEEVLEPGTTGRYVITIAPTATQQGLDVLGRRIGVSPDATAEGDEEMAASELDDPEATVSFEDLGIIVTRRLSPEEVGEAQALTEEDNPVLAIEPERVYSALQEEQPEEFADLEWPGARRQEEETFDGEASTSREPLSRIDPYLRGYLEGYKDAIQNLAEKISAGALVEVEEFIPAALAETQATWGLQVTRAATSQLSGRGIKVAILDTGLDLGHPDFQGRNIISRSFVPNETVQDGDGHGTHVAGTACGPRRPGGLPRYGIAYNSEIFIGKVLNNRRKGVTAQILDGMRWAINNGCQVVNMSLGRRLRQDESGFSAAYEQIGQLALQRGTLIIAAAGNDSARPIGTRPVSEPANSPSIMAVGALDESLQVASFSNEGQFPPHGAVDIAGPGVDVYSSFPRPQLYEREDGTSMAAPHVSGIAALWVETNGRFTGAALGRQLIRSARRLPLPRRDIGAGLVQAP